MYKIPIGLHALKKIDDMVPKMAHPAIILTNIQASYTWFESWDSGLSNRYQGFAKIDKLRGLGADLGDRATSGSYFSTDVRTCVHALFTNKAGGVKLFVT